LQAITDLNIALHCGNCRALSCAEGFWSRDIILAAYSGVTGFDALQKQGRRHAFRQREGSIRDRSETDLSDRRHNSSRTTTPLCKW